ncbi:hypothetical protein ACFL01_02950 [Planctomycetota bacterium]
MDTVQDFEDLLELLHNHQARYLIVGGLAFIYHAKPRYTKDMDLWVDPSADNIARANKALEEFGSPTLLAENEPTQVVQIGVAPSRIDLIVSVGDTGFDVAWEKRIESRYGDAPANWIDLDTLIDVKSRIDHPKHQEDARVLKEVKRLREEG